MRAKSGMTHQIRAEVGAPAASSTRPSLGVGGKISPSPCVRESNRRLMKLGSYNWKLSHLSG